LDRSGDVATIQSVFGEMRDVATRKSLEATLLSYAGLALGVLFGDPDEALKAARAAVAMTAEGRSYRLRTLLRLIVVLQYRGMLELPESKPVVREAQELARRSGDVLLHFSIESNLAVAALDAGDLESAETQMIRSSALAGSADMDLNRLIQANNRAELAMAQREFGQAQVAYADALAYMGPTTPAYLTDLVHAGIGLCALESGNLREARRREGELRAPPTRWHFDPTMILAFRSRLLDRRRETERALDLLEAAAGDVEHRLVLAWFKLCALQVRLLKKVESPRAATLARDCLRRAERLNLVHREREFRALLESVRSVRGTI
jgi:hypothetical protein